MGVRLHDTLGCRKARRRRRRRESKRREGEGETEREREGGMGGRSTFEGLGVSNFFRFWRVDVEVAGFARLGSKGPATA